LIGIGSTVIATVDVEYGKVKKGEKYTVTDIQYSKVFGTILFLRGAKEPCFANCFDEVLERRKD
jgi:hypothetical protein